MNVPVDELKPKPWETVVRIKVHHEKSISFGSGTIIASTQSESLIITCGHLFLLRATNRVRVPERPDKIQVDLFDGKLQQPPAVAQVKFTNETYAGELIDCDSDRDVALIRIRPRRRLFSSPVVPPQWKPKADMKMLTVGCSNGEDATAWHTSIITPSGRPIAGKDAYEAIECTVPPKQGRTGGGLFTADGYLAGVCNFADPKNDSGLYASPGAIHRLLDQNGLSALYRASPGDRPPNKVVAESPALARPWRPSNTNLNPVKGDDRKLEPIVRSSKDGAPDARRTSDSTRHAGRSETPAADHSESARLKDVERRLDRVETKLDRLIEALERSGPNRSSGQ
jgi:hypothetical protein